MPPELAGNPRTRRKMARPPGPSGSRDGQGSTAGRCGGQVRQAVGQASAIAPQDRREETHRDHRPTPITKVVDDLSDDDGWANLGAVGQNLTKLRPDFDPRLYGFTKLSALVKAQAQRIEVRETAAGQDGGKTIDVRVRRR